MKYIFSLLALILSCGYTENANAQALPPFQPEQDACNAIPLCGGAFVTPYSYSGYGLILEQSQFVNGGCFSETNSVWFKLTVATAGNIVFTLTPFSTLDDYDFAIWNITNSTCSTGINSGANRVRCNGNTIIGSASNVVGLNLTSTLINVPGGTLNQNFNQYIAASAGDVYYIMVDNFSASASGFTLDLTGSTATFVGDGPPMYDSIVASTNCNTSTGLKVRMNQAVRCNSIAPNGSDFGIVPALATVTSAVGTGCVANGYTSEITLTFSNPLPQGTYTLQAQVGTDGNTLMDLCPELQLVTDSILFKVRTPLVVNAGLDTNICIGMSTQLTGAFTGGGTVNTVAWTPATGLSSASILNPVATPTNNQTYTLTVTPDGLPLCAVTDAVTVGVLQGFSITTPPTTLCRGESISIVVNGDPRYTYTWSPGTGLSSTTTPNTVATPDTTRAYTLTATYPGCQPASQSILISVEPVPTVNAGRDTVLCYGYKMQLTPTVAPPFPNYTYSWTPAASFDNPASLAPRFVGLDSITATLTVTTPDGCKGKDSLIIDVVPRDFATISVDTLLCPRDTAQLRASGGVKYLWTPKLGLSSDTAASPMASPVTSTLYTVVVTNDLNCRDTQSVEVTVHPGALLALPDSVRIHPGESYQMDPGGNCLYFRWWPPLGLSADTIANPIAQPPVNTRYFVTAVTEIGCPIFDSIDVYVDAQSFVNVPNAFTPSGAGANAALKPERRGIVSIEYFRVYNRWGQKLYETNQMDAGWDGTFNGQPQPMGAYIWELNATTSDGKRVKRAGNVTLIR